MPPTEFHWILPGTLAGSGRPGLLRPLDHDLDALEELGISVIVCLTEAPFPCRTETYEPRLIHFAIDDMGTPTPRAAAELCAEVGRAIDGGDRVLMHCKAGLGRTGTMLACYLIRTGLSVEDAVTSIRRHTASYIQTQSQRAFLGHFEKHLKQQENSIIGGKPVPAVSASDQEAHQ